jgi:nicotinate-nucleotide pyrophosphorylase (carboxylating)
LSLAEPVSSALREAGLNPVYVEDLVRATLEEDLDGGTDVTSEATVPAEQRAQATLVAREAGLVAGLPVVEAVFEAAGGDVEVQRRVAEGSWVEPGTPVLAASGPARQILLAERTALNLGARLSGIATETSKWAHVLSDLGTVVRDTRKTTPLLRPLEKYAVRMGGGENHRSSLSESALIKDNHVAIAGGVTAAYRAVKAAAPGISVEIEVDTVAEAIEAVEAGADLVLLDNFSVDQVREAVAAVNGRARLEVSGSLTLDSARAYGETGVDYLAVGALTHSVKALDMGLDVETGEAAVSPEDTFSFWAAPSGVGAAHDARDSTENSVP